MTDLQVPELRLGKYRHYKGGAYEIVGVAKHSEMKDQWLVIYRQLESGILFARPYEMFVENVTVRGQIVPRFAYLSSDNK